MMNGRAKYPNTHSTSSSETNAPNEPSPMIDPFEQPPCLGSNIFNEALRKSDQVYQNLMENSLALNHKLDELIESLKSLTMEINEEDFAKHKYHEQQDLERQQQEHSDQISEKDAYELDHEFEMAREGFEILRFTLGLASKSHDKYIDDLDNMENEENPIPSVDKSEPRPLPNFSPLDVNLGDKRGTDPPNNPYSPGSFRMKVIFDKESPEVP
ncbi:hypothetical protein Tco_0944734 [Tanacetum coccineum]